MWRYLEYTTDTRLSHTNHKSGEQSRKTSISSRSSMTMISAQQIPMLQYWIRVWWTARTLMQFSLTFYRLQCQALFLTTLLPWSLSDPGYLSGKTSLFTANSCPPHSLSTTIIVSTQLLTSNRQPHIILKTIATTNFTIEASILIRSKKLFSL